MSKISKGRKHSRKTKKWQLQEAKARFSELVSEVEHGDYQIITKNGHEVAVIISKEDFENLQKPKNTLLAFFSEAPYPEVDLDLERKDDLGREIDL
jgi:prevent-host-death family protein